MASLAGKASGARGFNNRAVKADLDTVLKALNEVETRRAVAFERVALLGEGNQSGPLLICGVSVLASAL